VTPASAPLDGILVLDLSRVLAGPFSTMLLADLGARVIKVEHPLDGDVTRSWGPPYEPGTGMSAYYLAVNRNKESIALDLATEAGRRSVAILASRADVVLENFPPGTLERFGLSLSTMRAANPRLVTASITGFGRTGPDASSPGFDLLAQAGGGLMAITGHPDGPPTKIGVAVSDLFAGCFTAIAIAAALAGRERTGCGTHVETDLFRSTLAALVNVGQSVLVTGEEGQRFGNAHPQIVPYGTFSASDGDLALAVGTDRQFARLAALVGRPEWASDPEFQTNPARVANRSRVERELNAILREHPRDVWLAKLKSAAIPAGPVRGPLEALRSDAARALGAVVSVLGVGFLRSPMSVGEEEPAVRFPPSLDEHGDALRREFGLPDRDPGPESRVPSPDGKIGRK
jgi:crotonobetainyl-CoA:carnitine CoA-transferase CaiB-like acyl-CoA transferase